MTDDAGVLAEAEALASLAVEGGRTPPGDAAARQDLFVRQPSYMTALGKLLQEVGIEDWKNYLRFQVINNADVPPTVMTLDP